jgi:hypothetical protein
MHKLFFSHRNAENLKIIFFWKKNEESFGIYYRNRWDYGLNPCGQGLFTHEELSGMYSKLGLSLGVLGHSLVKNADKIQKSGWNQ